MSKINNILQIVETLEIDPAVKAELMESILCVKKDVRNNDFRINRIQVEKTITEKFLNKTIDDLTEKQIEIAEINDKLEKQKQALTNQKLLVDQQSQALTKKVKELENSYDELEQFSYIASHDLKSPLRTIGTFSQLLEKRLAGKLDEHTKEYLSFIVKGIRQMNTVIDDLLHYSRVGVNQGDFQILDLNEVLELVKFNLTRDIEENKGTLEIEPLPKAIYANRSSVIQIFQNLIGNAIKFRGLNDPIVKVSCIEDNEGFLFTVKDNGVGMDQKFHDKAFQPFQRLNNQERPGTGMGLAICRKIALLHDGDISFESEVGLGTTFRFKISKNIHTNSKAGIKMAEASN